MYIAFAHSSKYRILRTYFTLIFIGNAITLVLIHQMKLERQRTVFFVFVAGLAFADLGKLHFRKSCNAKKLLIYSF